ncbi:MAG: division/cell wall cluster transcriptional repressor MraZ [Nocardioidaceae bacterium]|jgi:MraZ protein|nr:division/cell wall cluster transcriptional repressor MraZ [Nocardioidaceae bacterium]
MFFGTHTPRLDEKGRLTLPARFREALGEGLVMTKGQDRCLYVFPRADFARTTERLAAAPVTDKRTRDFLRVFYSGATDEVPDKQGRVTIPPALRSYASLSRDCTVIGANARIEVWDTAAWERFMVAQEQAFSELEDEVVPGVI